jgi:predicted secreted protein
MRTALAAIFLLATSLPALSADADQSRAIGYSADWKYFAYETWGIQDGSGFPHWGIFVLDLAADRWVPGTPVEVVIDNEEARLTEARAKAHDKAAPILDRLAIGEPADLLLANPATEAPGDRRAGRFDFYYRSGLAGVSGSYELKVAKVALQAPAGCAEAEEPVVGMEASLRNTETGVARIIARDAAIPASRHCPTDYDIEAVYAPSSYGTSARNVALIGVYSRGFEGYNRSLIAIPFDALD